VEKKVENAVHQIARVEEKAVERKPLKKNERF